MFSIDAILILVQHCVNPQVWNPQIRRATCTHRSQASELEQKGFNRTCLCLDTGELPDRLPAPRCRTRAGGLRLDGDQETDT